MASADFIACWLCLRSAAALGDLDQINKAFGALLWSDDRALLRFAHQQAFRIVKAMLHGRCPDILDHEGIADTALVAIARKAHTIDDVHSWLVGVIHNLVVKEVDKDKKQNDVAKRILDELLLDSAREGRVSTSRGISSGPNRSPRSVTPEDVASALRELPETLRSVGIRHFYDEIDYNDIAEELNISIENVRQRARRFRQEMQKRLLRDVHSVNPLPTDPPVR